jgi:hypothetical protein
MRQFQRLIILFLLLLLPQSGLAGDALFLNPDQVDLSRLLAPPRPSVPLSNCGKWPSCSPCNKPDPHPGGLCPGRCRTFGFPLRRRDRREIPRKTAR